MRFISFEMVQSPIWISDVGRMHIANQLPVVFIHRGGQDIEFPGISHVVSPLRKVVGRIGLPLRGIPPEEMQKGLEG